MREYVQSRTKILRLGVRLQRIRLQTYTNKLQKDIEVYMIRRISWFLPVIIVSLMVNSSIAQEESPELVNCVSEQGEIAYLSATEGFPNLYMMAGDGSEQSLFATSIIDFAWSPDGSQIALTSYDGNSLESVIQVVDLETQTAVDVIRGDAQSFGVQWSPDGLRLAFNTGIGDHLQAFMANMETQQVQQLTTGDVDHFVGGWSPDGTQLAVVASENTGSRLAVINVADGTMTDVTEAIDGAFDEFAGWTPDGGSILFNSNRSGDPNLTLHIVFLDNNVMRRLIGQYAYGLTWASDGTWFTYMAREFNANFVNLFRMNWQTGEVTQITPDSTLAHDTFFAPSLSPDNSMISFEATNADNSAYAIYTVNSDGTNLTQLTDNSGQYTSPQWRPCA